MHSHPVALRRRVAACFAVAALGAGFASTVPAGDVFVMRQSVVSNGGGFIFDNCYRLFAVVGQPVLGVVGNSEFILESGFLTSVPSTDDKLFRSGFETSTGACKP
ncbi:MAG: hypothetical protein ABIR62_08360 [Dokdonella sp.]|uniref:hypothetical protein n=1 Tax=Dokdonella sp. TaxID=2291710 RepID=UPI0032666ADE